MNAISEIAVLLRNGKSVRQSAEMSGLPITRIETIANGTINPAKVGFADLGESDCADWLLRDGDILISHINSTKHLGKCAIYEGDPPTLVHGMNLLALRVDPEAAASRYVYRILSSTGFRRKLHRITKHSVNQSSFNISSFEKLQIPLPPLDQQKRIAGILDAADALRAKRRESLALLDTLLQSTFLDMFGDPVTNPMGWEAARLDDVAEFHAGSTLPVGEEYTGQVAGYLHLKVSELNDPENTPTVQRSRIWSVARGKGIAAPRQSVVFPKRGGAIGTNKKRLLARNAVLDPNLMAVSALDRLNYLYLYAWFLTFDLLSITSGSSVPQLNKRDLAPLPIQMPPLDLQHSFETICGSVERQTAVHRAHLDELDTLFASLQSRAFSGDL